MKLDPEYVLRIALAVDQLDRQNPDWWEQYAGGLTACIGCGRMVYWKFENGKSRRADSAGDKFKHGPGCPAGCLSKLLKRARKA